MSKPRAKANVQAIQSNSLLNETNLVSNQDSILVSCSLCSPDSKRRDWFYYESLKRYLKSATHYLIANNAGMQMENTDALEYSNKLSERRRETGCVSSSFKLTPHLNSAEFLDDQSGLKLPAT